MDVFDEAPASSGLQGFGRKTVESVPFRPRGGFVEVTAWVDGRRVRAEDLPVDARPPNDRPWSPLELMAVIDRAGLASPLVVTEGSRVEEVDLQVGGPAEIDATLRVEIASILTLLKARSELALGREPAALETLKRLRDDYPRTDAAISSYLIESEYYAAQDKIDEARNRLIGLTDNTQYATSPYFPYALYRLALLTERLGREENLKEANQRIEDLVKTTVAAADPGLLFAARLRQGDIFRKLNDFPAAQRAYEYLVINYAQRPDVVVAQLALADCHNIQASPPPGQPEDPSHADKAQLLFEQLRDRVDAPRDVRVEAGFKLGLLLARRGRLEEAAKVWWSDVITPFLVDDAKPPEPDAKRPYWLARTLTELGDLQEKRGKFEEAKAAYLLLLEKRLPFGGTIARTRLEQMGVQVLRPGQ
jgi:tetratricopeptide (TPR) repeat protein